MNDGILNLKNKKESFLKNVLFYSILTSIIFAIHAFHIYVHFFSDLWLGVKLATCALFESILEGAILCFLGAFFSQWRLFHGIYILFAAFIPVLHLIDFVLERMFNLSVVHTMQCFFSESLSNMLELLYATNFPLWTWILGFASLILVSLGFLFFYKITEKKLHYTFRAHHGFYISVFGFLSISVYLPLKISLKENLSLAHHEKKVLPFKDVLTFETPQKGMQKVRLVSKEDKFSKKPYEVPFLFVFVVESLREDAIFSQSAPHLTQLGNDFYRHPFCIAGANGTHLSWFSLFHSEPAIFWKQMQSTGSPFLRKLKNQGYKIHTLSSARLSYYGMDKTIFGEKLELQDSHFCPKHEASLTAFEADKACFDNLKSALDSSSSKTAFIVFLDATHFGYSLPDNAEIVFEPHIETVPYFSSVFSQVNVNGIKNRYLNTIHAVDGLFGDFFETLKQKAMFDESCILVTADHGEEFFEKGQLFHASHLSQEQLHIPFIFKAPKNTVCSPSNIETFSHADMFPFLDAMLSNQPFHGKTRQMAARYNFSQTPREYVFVSRRSKELVFFDEKSKTMNLRFKLDQKDQPIVLKNELKTRGSK